MSDENGSNPDQDKGSRKPLAPSPKLSRNVMSWLVLLGIAMVLVVLLQSQRQQRKEITISRFSQEVDKGSDSAIESLSFQEDGWILGKLSRPLEEDTQAEPPLQFKVLYPPSAFEGGFIENLVQKLPHAKIKAEKTPQLLIVLANLLPWLLIFAFIWFVIFRQIRNASGGGGMLGSFGRSRHRVMAKEQIKVSLNDVAGIDEAKEEVGEIIEFLRSPKKFTRLGGRIPRGVLLVGEPGCGKTLLAKAIAGEADVPFFSISGSDFVEMFVGVGASRVRDLFKQAKENAPCIIFLDEIDAVGRKRGASFGGGGHDEREQTLNAILVEMDGFETNQGVILIAATNRVDVLDPALIRPGRFDRQVFVSLPDLQGRYEILKVHAHKIKLGPAVDLRRIARGTPMFSGADLAALVNEAAIIATLEDKDAVEQDDLEEARDKVRWGRSKKSRKVDDWDRKTTAYHEAGHALIQALEKEADPVHKVSIIPRGPYGGATFSLPEKDRMVLTKGHLMATLRVLFGGRIAEEIFCDEISSGAAADIKQATGIVRHMIRELGMGDKAGFVFYGEQSNSNMLGLPSNDYSEKTAQLLDEEIKELLDSSFADSRRIIEDNRKHVEAIAQALLKYETISGEEVNALIRGENLDRASVSDLLDQAGDRSPDVGVARPVPSDRKRDTSSDIEGGPLPQPG